MNKKTFNCVELFSGAGGMLLGIKQAGFQTLLANEIHSDPCKTLSTNFPKVRIIKNDIRKISAKQLLNKANLKLKLLRNIDLLAGGPPCQGLSTAGLKNVDDPRNNLIGEFVRMVKEFRPKIFLMENVSGLASMYNGKLFNNLLNEFSIIKYNVKHKILYSPDYGIPQMRKRMFIIGSMTSNLPDFPSPTHFEENSLFQVNGKNKYATCYDAIGDLPKINQGEKTNKYDKKPKTLYQKIMREGSKVLFNHEASKHKEETIKYYSLVPPNGTYYDIPFKYRKKKEGIQRWPLKSLSRTITTEPTDFLHPTLNRIPTVREIARIQSFPDKFKFEGQRTTGNKMRRLGYCSQTQQVGNAVPPLLAKAIAKEIKKYLLKLN